VDKIIHRLIAQHTNQYTYNKAVRIVWRYQKGNQKP